MRTYLKDFDMNERIEELARDCWSTSKYDTTLDPWFNYKKFAELIIRECAEVARLNTRVDSKVYLMIKEHFGVEE